MKNRRATIHSIARLIVDVSEKWSGSELKQTLETIGEWLYRNGLGRHLPMIHAEVEKLILEKNGKVRVEVSSARSLGEASKKILAPLLAQLLGKEVVPQYKEQPNVVGGVRAQTDTHLIRASVADALGQLVS
ncbi:F0F1 ATP synthase subunit delta [Candidatus Uhrbacteria bacterium]|nr:F0F1 ATP synthase subunit delta [Candidatus Uhrbacteria bacterium]